MSETAPTTLYIIDDDSSVLLYLCAVVKDHGLDPVPFKSAEEFLEGYDPEVRSILLLDINMPQMNGLELQLHLSTQNSNIPIVIVSSYGDVPIVVEAMRNGAFDFIEKPVDVNALLKTLALAKKQIDLEMGQGVSAAETTRRLALLTDREREVMDHLILGKTNKQIADELSISRRTVEIHRARLQNKMEARNLADLIQFAR